MPRVRVGVIGAGVIGLPTALNIIEKVDNVDVSIISHEFSPNTTGDYSAGLWEPFVSSGPNIRKWSKITFDHLLKLAQSELAGKLGAQFCSGYQLGEADADWSDIVFGYRPMSQSELALFPFSKSRSGAFFTSITIECSMYLPWIMSKFKERGGKVVQKWVNSVKEISDEFDVIVNCCGISAWNLVDDKEVIPVRGQVMKLHAPWIKHFVFMDDVPLEGHVTYILPGAKAVTVGGTIQKGNWNNQVDEKDSHEIWDRCVKLLPSIKEGRRLYEWAGLRPFRPNVRLETEMMKVNGKNIPVVHNYGHGGSGVTLHWGCALEATELTWNAIQTVHRNQLISKL